MHWIGSWLPPRPAPEPSTGAVEIPEERYSELGVVVGGTTVAAGTALPATGGKVTLQPGATTWIRITGTAAKVGDQVVHSFPGSRVSTPTNPAVRRKAEAGPGDVGAVLADGVIELSLSSTNPDAAESKWHLVGKAA